MTALRLSSAHLVRAFGLILRAGRGFYDSATTIERGYPFFHFVSDYRPHALDLARACSFLNPRISVCILCWMGRSSVDYFSTYIGRIGSSFACNLGYNIVYNPLYPIIQIMPCSFLHI